MFATKDTRTDLKRIYGYTSIKDLGVAMFPAFLPFAEHVVSDLEIVYGKDGLEWLPAAQKHLDYLRDERARQTKDELPVGFDYVTVPFDHQNEGVIRGLYEPRTALFFDCGLGKTKTAIDLLRALAIKMPGMKALVVCPPHLAPTWAHEFETHGDGALKVRTFFDGRGKTIGPKKRHHAYAGTRPVEPQWGDDRAQGWGARFPDVVYTPLPASGTTEAWGELYVLQDEYLEAVHAEDQKAKTSLRGKMSRLAKKLGVKLPAPAKKVAPAPEPAANYDVIVLPYSVLYGDLSEIAQHIPFNVIVCDESHMLRSQKSRRSRAVRKLGTRATNRYLLSGTPALGTPMHLYVQLSLLANFLTGSWWQFYKRYCVARRVRDAGQEHDEVVAFKALNVLNEIVTEVSLRKKAEDCLDLPPVRTISYDIHVGDETRGMYNELVRDFEAEIGGTVVQVAHAADRLTKLQQVLSGFIIDSQKNYELCNTAAAGEPCPYLMECAELKIKPYTPKCSIESENPPKLTEFLHDQDRLEQSMDLLRNILTSPGNKVIVWATYRAEIEMLSEAFDDEDWDFVVVDGRTKDKVAAKDRFNNVESCRLYLSQISTGVGITLNAANYTVFYNATFDLADYIQAQKRNDRIGQKRPVTVYQLVVPGSVNEYIFRSLAKKRDISAALTDHIQCILCSRNKECEAAGTKPFDKDCVYSSKEGKLRMKPALLP